MLDQVCGDNKFSYFGKDMEVLALDYYMDYAEKFIRKIRTKINDINVDKEFIFQYYRKPEFDARILIGENCDNIYMAEHVILKVYEFFYKANNFYEVCQFNSIMKYEKEVTKIQLESGDEKGRKLIVEFVYSNNISRNIIAEYMAMFAIKFIIAHEFGHLFNGHCYYSNSKNESKVEFFMSKNNNGILGVLDAQTLEMDADAFGICIMVEEVNEIIMNNSDPIFKIIKNKWDLFQILSAAIHGAFYLMRKEIVNYENEDHPPAMLREILCMESLQKKLERLIDTKLPEGCFDKNAVDLEGVINAINRTPEEDRIDNLSRLKELGPYSNKIMDNWRNNLRYKLKGFSLLPIEGIDFE